jgi:chromosome segregation ATPase
MSNTKKEMLEAYQTIKQQFKAKEKQVLDAEKARRQLEKQVAETTAEAQTSQDPLQRLHDLKGAISRELTSLAERFEGEIETFQKVQSAVKAKQEELNTIYEVETAASDLAALVEAQQAKKADFQQEMDTRRAETEKEIQETRAAWEREKAAHDQEVKEQAEALKKQRQREKEEYEYAFAREKEQRKNKLEDELEALSKEIEQKRQDFEQEINVTRAELDSREDAITKREANMDDLQKEVESFPQQLNSEVKKTITETTERLTNDFEKNEALLQARFEGEKNVLLSKIEHLEKLVKAQETQVAELSKRNEQAYEKVQDIANRAVAGAKREYISVPAAAETKTRQNDK